MKLAILGESHTQIYKSICTLHNFFESVNIHQCDSEDVARYGKFEQYLMNSIATKGYAILKYLYR
jgi:hypothetical protein